VLENLDKLRITLPPMFRQLFGLQISLTTISRWSWKV